MNQSFDVDGMMCEHCVQSVRKAILQLDHDAQVRVDLATKKVFVDSLQNRTRITQAITDAGYSVLAAPAP